MCSFHVIITRVADTSERHAMGGASQVGKVTTSHTFTGYHDARREADAWNHAGEFARFGASDWSAEVHPGPAPAEPCGIKNCSVLTPHTH